MASVTAAPFAYQSDSSKSFEYSQNGWHNPGDLYDPSSFAGSVHYDERHHALFITGATFSNLFDGVDSYQVNREKGELNDNDPNNDGFWWNDKEIGMHPHMGDPGIPGYSPKKSDCFYAVMALPVDGASVGGNEPKLVHSRRFGTENVDEACSAMDILFSDEVNTGQYIHGFEQAPSIGKPQQQPSLAAETFNPEPSATNEFTFNTGPTGITAPTFIAEANTPTYEPTAFDDAESDNAVTGITLPAVTTTQNTPTYEPSAFDDVESDIIPPFTYTAAEPTSTNRVTTFPSSSPSSSTYEPTDTNWPSSSPTSATYEPTASRFGGNSFFGGGRRNKHRSLQEMRSVRLLMAGHIESPNGQDGYAIDALPTTVKRDDAHVYAFAQQVDVRLPSGFLSNDVLDSEEGEKYEYNLLQEADSFVPNDGLSEDDWASQNNPAYDPNVPDQFEFNPGPENTAGESTSTYKVTTFPSSSPSSSTYEPTTTNWPSETPSSATYEPTASKFGAGNFFGGERRNKSRTLLGSSGLTSESVEDIQDEFDGVVTSGVDARALLDDRLPIYINAMYPVSLVGDPTTKKHYYVASLASRQAKRNVRSNNGLNIDPTIGAGASQRSWTDFIETGNHEGKDHFGGASGRPNFGEDYMIVLKKVAIEGVNPACVDANGSVNNCAGSYSNAEQLLSSKDYDEKNVAMKQEWYQEYEAEGGVDVRPSGLLFAPSGDPTGKGDTLIMVGTTSGFGNAFGMAGTNDGFRSQDGSGGLDLDGFIMKIRTDTGVFAGHSKFDPTTSSFLNMHSHRIQSLPMKDDIIAGICSRPLNLSGNQEKMRHIYVVGSTESLLPGIASGLRDDGFLSEHPIPKGGKSMEAFLMKVDVDTLDPIWTVQVGSIHADGVNTKGNAFGFGCAVTPDGDDVYLTGMANQGGLVTDFSMHDARGIPTHAHGGTDMFIASYKTTDGARNFVRQIGSTSDDFPSRSDGGVTTDRLGNAILTGHTRGSIARRRDSAEYKYGDNKNYAAADIFVMSFDRATGDHVGIVDDGIPPPTSGQQSVEKVNRTDATIVGVVAIALCFVFAAIAGVGTVAYKIKAGKKEHEERRFMSTNLRERRPSESRRSRRRSVWGMKKQSSSLSALQNLNVMVEVRNSASGGWHGVYDDDQLQVIDFGMPTGYRDNVVEQSLFMEDDLKLIEEASIGNYEIGDIEDVSDEDLIKAYNDAMAVDIEPENPDVQFAMAGLGSQQIFDDDHQIT